MIYRKIKNQSISHGEEIYKNYENRKLYLDQIGITKEQLEINSDADKNILGREKYIKSLINQVF